MRNLALKCRDFLLRPLLNPLPRPFYADAATQLHLQFMYRSMLHSGVPMPALQDTGFKVHSQTDEDGILLYIFSVLGSGTRRAVEICSGDGIECNTANLILNHGWQALLVDGDEKQITRGRDYYRTNPNTYVYPPVFQHAWVTRDNVNSLIRDAGFAGDVDLLSIDMDSTDYWIWEAIDCVEPKVVVVEYQDILGPDLALTIPYSDTFNGYAFPASDGMPNYCGASLPAFVKLARRKGFRLVGCNRLGYNAFFVRDPLAIGVLPEVDVRSCFGHAKTRHGMEHRFPQVRDLPWVEV